MVSDFMKQLAAERIARSQFKGGACVAIVNHHRDRRIVGKRTIAKVYKNGNFILAGRNEGGPPETQQWRPDADGTSACRAGSHTGFRHSEHLEPWTPAIEQEIMERRVTHNAEKRRDAIIEKLKNMRGGDLRDRISSLEVIEDALGMTAFGC